MFQSTNNSLLKYLLFFWCKMAKYAASGKFYWIFIALENIRQSYELISYDFISLM